MRAARLLVVGLDGTVIDLDDRAGVRVYPEASAMMQAWVENGGRVLCVTNRGGIALGKVTAAQVGASLDEVSRQLRTLAPPGWGCPIDAYEVCVHHPDADGPEMARCWCRIPSPGLVIRGVERLVARFSGQETYPLADGLMVGAGADEELCARLAGLDYLDAVTWRAGAAGLEKAVELPDGWRTPPLELNVTDRPALDEG